MAQINVKVLLETEGVLARAFIDGVSLRFVSGRASKKVAAGEEHTLYWYVRGAPGSTYTIEVASPKNVAMKHSATLDDSQVDVGDYWFTP